MGAAIQGRSEQLYEPGCKQKERSSLLKAMRIRMTAIVGHEGDEGERRLSDATSI